MLSILGIIFLVLLGLLGAGFVVMKLLDYANR